MVLGRAKIGSLQDSDRIACYIVRRLRNNSLLKVFLIAAEPSRESSVVGPSLTRPPLTGDGPLILPS
jgi:hypothetical protein